MAIFSIEDCKNKQQSYDVVCVICNKCGRFNNESSKKKQCVLDEFCLCSHCGASQKGIRKKYQNYCSNCGAKIKENNND